MAVLEVEPHWITEVVRRRYGKSVRPDRVTVCDQCGLDGLLPRQLHTTLYHLKGTETWLCEIHAILAGRRPPTPELRRAVERVRQLQQTS